MKKKLKVIFIYLGVALLSILMTVAICAAFLFFYRDGSIFGIKYIKNDEVLSVKTSDIAVGNINGVSIKSEGFDIKLGVNPYNDEVQGAMVNKTFGYTHKSKARAGFSAKYDEGTGTIIFDVVEPSGWISKKNCYIAIIIPESLIDNGIDINVSSQKGDILIGGNKKMFFGQVDVASTKGEIELTNIDMSKNFNINLGSGLLYVDDKCSANNINVNIKLGSGKINLTRIDNFEIKTLRVEEIKSGKIGVLKAWEVVTAGSINGGGQIEVGQVVELEILTLDTDIKIGTVGELGSEKVLTSRIDIKGNGSVEVMRSHSGLVITGHNGDVKVGTATGTVTVSTNQGDIDISDAYGNVSVDTQYGNANIQFGEDAPEYSAGGRTLIAGTKNGHIIARGIQNASVTIREKGRATLDYDLVRGLNIITANQIGSINIVVPYKHDEESIALDLVVVSEIVPDVEVGAVSSDQVELIEGEYSLEVDDIYGSNIENAKLQVKSATGNIKIRSKDMIDF